MNPANSASMLALTELSDEELLTVAGGGEGGPGEGDDGDWRYDDEPGIPMTCEEVSPNHFVCTTYEPGWW